MSPRQQEILSQANERYGEGVYFAYFKPSDGDPVNPSDEELITMTIDHALLACPHIARESDSELWKTLDNWREVAVKLEAYPDLFEESKASGYDVLALKGIEV